MIDKLDDSTLSDVERFLLQVGSKTGYDCIKSLRCMLQFVREKVKEEKGEQREEYDKSEPSYHLKIIYTKIYYFSFKPIIAFLHIFLSTFNSSFIVPPFLSIITQIKRY